MGEGRVLGKAAVAFAAWEDEIILDRVTKGRPLSAHVRTGRTVDAIMRRYDDLVKGRAKHGDERKGERPITEKRRESIRRGMEKRREL